MNDPWPVVEAISTAASVLVAIAGFLLLYLQLRSMQRSIHTGALEALYGRMHSINQIFLADPDLRTYFYDNRQIVPSNPDYQKVMAAAEMLVDFFQQIHLQQDDMSHEVCESWKSYINAIHASSPAVRLYVEERKGWYVPSFPLFTPAPLSVSGPVDREPTRSPRVADRPGP